MADFGVNAALIACVIVLTVGGLICWAWAPETGTESLVDIAEDVQRG